MGKHVAVDEHLLRQLPSDIALTFNDALDMVMRSLREGRDNYPVVGYTRDMTIMGREETTRIAIRVEVVRERENE